MAIIFSGDPVGVWIALITIGLVMVAVLINLGNIGRAIIDMRVRKEREGR